MKTKGVVVLIASCVIFSSIFYFLAFNGYHDDEQVDGKKRDLKPQPEKTSSFEALKAFEEVSPVDSILLSLGFKPELVFKSLEEVLININNTVIEHHQKKDEKRITFVSSVTFEEKNVVESTTLFIKRIFKAFPGVSLVIYALDLTPQDLIEIENNCKNESLVENHDCLIKRFDVNHFPNHLLNDLRFFRSILIQDLIHSFEAKDGTVVWIDFNLFPFPCPSPSSSSSSPSSSSSSFPMNRLREALNYSSSSLTLFNLMEEEVLLPTSSLTHDKMFTFFGVKREDYFFRRVVDPSIFILKTSNKKIMNEVLFSWIKCVLQVECLSPLGSQSTGCRFDKKPLYRYSGCHHYDVSALNIVLGKVFDSNNFYSPPDNSSIFMSRVDPCLEDQDDNLNNLVQDKKR